MNKPEKNIRVNKRSDWHFDVSTGLKRVLGTELITDDEVAVFELVKNSFDARSRKVFLYFDPDRIIVADNGHGMSRKDLQKKWLFVAYSSKRDVNRSKDRKDFRDDVARRQNFAGSKGIGRFSSDRLGDFVTVQTRHKAEATGQVHQISVNWRLFDNDHTQHFEDIDVLYSRHQQFVLPEGIPSLKFGTVIEIKGLRRPWSREDILQLKDGLAKLINPFGSQSDRFAIEIIVPSEIEEDAKVESKAKPENIDLLPRKLVNGEVRNFIFAKLQEKTTYIDVRLDRSGRHIESKLVDRGELIYRIREPNPYQALKASKFRCQLFFLNLAAKINFARRVGLRSVQFGSVFLFRNDFRVFPIGEEGDDWFKLDRRKQQGFARYLGTRDIIGRIDVSGGDNDFQEASSRNEGLIDTPAVQELRECFIDNCLRRLERYVVPVTWVDKEDKRTDDLSRLLTDPGRARVSAAVASLVDNDQVELLGYSSKLIDLLNERSEQFEESLISLRSIAEKQNDRKLLGRIEKAERRFEEIKASEAEARRIADEEREARDKAETRANAAQATVEIVTEQLTEEKKRNLFLTSITSLDTDTILSLHHQITIYAVDVQQRVENLMQRVIGKQNVPSVDVISALEQIAFLNKRIMAISKFATKANFRLQSEAIEADLAAYFVEYIDNVAKTFLGDRLRVEVRSDEKVFVFKFKPIDVSILIDNLIGNARKARAKTISFDLTQPQKSALYIEVSDDGVGLSKIIAEPEQIFEKGFTTTEGSGLGLYHVRQVLNALNGSIGILDPEEGQVGMRFLIRIGK